MSQMDTGSIASGVSKHDETLEEEPVSLDVDGGDPIPELVCIEYPGVVNSTGKMLETLGGLETIAQVLEEPNRRLELRFRPDDVFCKPTCGEKQTDSSFLIRVKKKKLKPGREPSEDRPAVKTEVKVEGIVTDNYKFNNLCDFQYLPMVYNAEQSAHTDIYAKVSVIMSIPDTKCPWRAGVPGQQ